jgi:predicted RNA-binding protein YlxR (DUF448 family)
VVRHTSPVRTCIGCRKRVPASELLRFFVAVRDGDHLRLQPDPDRRLPGRGAHLHPDPACLALAERRRAFGRALRVAGVLDTGPVAEALPQQDGTADGGSIEPHPDRKVGRPT